MKKTIDDFLKRNTTKFDHSKEDIDDALGLNKEMIKVLNEKLISWMLAYYNHYDKAPKPSQVVEKILDEGLSIEEAVCLSLMIGRFIGSQQQMALKSSLEELMDGLNPSL
jgi:hypothetical protein